MGDTQWDEEAARQAGLPFVYASYGFGNVPQAFWQLSDFSKLPELADKLLKEKAGSKEKEGINMIRKAAGTDRQTVASLMVQLWPQHSREEMMREIDELIRTPGNEIFLAFVQGEPVGFAQCGLRYDHVEGTNSFPVGYLQGVFVKAQFRRRGIASQLLSRCEDWAREKGCTEIGSDCAMSNRESATFHLKKGFEEADRIICFAKKL